MNQIDFKINGHTFELKKYNLFSGYINEESYYNIGMQITTTTCCNNIPEKRMFLDSPTTKYNFGKNYIKNLQHYDRLILITNDDYIISGIKYSLMNDKLLKLDEIQIIYFDWKFPKDFVNVILNKDKSFVDWPSLN